MRVMSKRVQNIIDTSPLGKWPELATIFKELRKSTHKSNIADMIKITLENILEKHINQFANYKKYWKL